MFIYFCKYLFQLFIILILLCSILHYVSHTVLLLIIKIVFNILRKLYEKWQLSFRMSTSALKIIVLMLLHAVVPRK